MLIEMKETVNSAPVCSYSGEELVGKELGKLIKVMKNSVPKEELYKYKITIDFKGK